MRNIAYLLISVAHFFCTPTVESLSADIWNEIAKAVDENRTFFLKYLEEPQFNKSADLNLDANLEKKDCEHECVPYYLCRNGTINTNGTGIIDVRSGASACSDLFEVCCKPKDISPTPLRFPPTPPPPTPTGCGLRRSDGLGVKVIGDELNESQIGEFPWMVAIMAEEESVRPLPKLKCGGALIHPQAVLTAAHCVVGGEAKLVVRAGEWDVSIVSEPHPHQDVKVGSVKVHPEYDASWLFNDLAVLHLEAPFKMAENVDVVCLPSQNQLQPMDSTRCIATGWGKDDFTRRTPPHKILKKLELPVVRRLACQRSLRSTRLGTFFRLHSSFMCAGGEEDEDMCSGDGGSPLVCPLEGRPGRYYQAGIVSWGIGCGTKGLPGVYVDVARFRAWIDQQLQTPMETTPFIDKRSGFLRSYKNV